MSAAPRSRLTDAQRALLWQLAANPDARVISTLRSVWAEDSRGAVLGMVRVRATVAALTRRGFLSVDGARMKPSDRVQVYRLTEAGRVAASETAAGGTL